MASTNKTELLKLPQWQDNEKLEMTDLNDAFEKVDTGLTTHLADFAKVNGQADLWNGYANSGNLTLSESVDNFSMLSISINKNPATSANKGIVVIPSFGLTSHNYIPVAFGTAMTWIRILVVGNIFTIHSVGNAELFITRISGLGRKPNT